MPDNKKINKLIDKNKDAMKKIANEISSIVNSIVNKKFNGIGNASSSNMLKIYLSQTADLSDVNMLKAEYSLPKDKEVFSKMGKEYQWNEDFSNELDELTEFIKRMPRIKEICSNVTWETHPNKFCICFHIKKQLLDYSNND